MPPPKGVSQFVLQFQASMVNSQQLGLNASLHAQWIYGSLLTPRVSVFNNAPNPFSPTLSPKTVHSIVSSITIITQIMSPENAAQLALLLMSTVFLLILMQMIVLRNVFGLVLSTLLFMAATQLILVSRNVLI